MPHVTFILGLAGSGKTQVAKEICAQTQATHFEGTFGPQNAQTKARLLQLLTGGRDAVVEEIAYCIPTHREAILIELWNSIPGIEIDLICFENDLDSANWNARHRKNKGDPDGHIRQNRLYHWLYVLPSGVQARPIKRVELDVSAV